MRLQKDRPWESDESMETETESAPSSGSAEDSGDFDSLLSGGSDEGEVESTEE